MNYFYAYVEDEREEQEMRQLQKNACCNAGKIFFCFRYHVRLQLP